MKFIQEIKSKIGQFPAYLHSDRGGEYSSIYLQSKLEALGISIEQGPANSPQTNGLAERFNQTLIQKMRCLLAQSSVPITLWDEAARYASMLINHLPSKALDWNCPIGVLEDNQSLIEPRRDLRFTIPFGLKLRIYRRNDAVPVSDKRTYSFLGYEPFSESARFLDNRLQKILLSQSYSFPESNFRYNDSDALKKRPESLPMIILADLPIKRKSSMVSISIGQVKSSQSSKLPSMNDLSSSDRADSPAAPDTKTHQYVPYFEKAPRDIDSSINTRNIITSTRRSNNNSSVNYCINQEQNAVDCDSINYIMKIMNPSTRSDVNWLIPTNQFQQVSTVPQLRRGVKVESSVAQLRRGVGVMDNCTTEDYPTEARPERKRSRMKHPECGHSILNITS